MVTMAYLAKCPGQPRNARCIAEKTGVSLATTSKLLKRLASHQLLLTQRGTQGGYQLALPPQDIPLGKIIQALEGQIALTACSHSSRSCDVEKQCMIRDNWRSISAFIKGTLYQISVADLIEPLPLKSLLKKPLALLENAE